MIPARSVRARIPHASRLRRRRREEPEHIRVLRANGYPRAALAWTRPGSPTATRPSGFSSTAGRVRRMTRVGARHRGGVTPWSVALPNTRCVVAAQALRALPPAPVYLRTGLGRHERYELEPESGFRAVKSTTAARQRGAAGRQVRHARAHLQRAADGALHAHRGRLDHADRLRDGPLPRRGRRRRPRATLHGRPRARPAAPGHRHQPARGPLPLLRLPQL